MVSKKSTGPLILPLSHRKEFWCVCVCVCVFFFPLSFRFGLLFFVFFPAVCSMQGFSSLTRDPIHTPCTEPPGNLWKLIQGSAPSTFLLCEYEKAALSPRGIS